MSGSYMDGYSSGPFLRVVFRTNIVTADSDRCSCGFNENGVTGPDRLRSGGLNTLSSIGGPPTLWCRSRLFDAHFLRSRSRTSTVREDTSRISQT